MPVIAQTIGLLVLSNVFMTFAWYAHLKELSSRPWIIAALISWGIALFEYLLQYTPAVAELKTKAGNPCERHQVRQLHNG